ncbi:MAG: amidohydrolase, partial [Chloroflexi bacterium]|nr:amidohydrolase [Chloroflexota bacterium]
IHPYLAITPNGIAGHTVAFRDAAISPAGMQGMLDAAKAMAMTAIDLLREPALLQNAKAELKKTRNEN